MVFWLVSKQAHNINLLFLFKRVQVVSRGMCKKGSYWEGMFIVCLLLYPKGYKRTNDDA